MKRLLCFLTMGHEWHYVSEARGFDAWLHTKQCAECGTVRVDKARAY